MVVVKVLETGEALSAGRAQRAYQAVEAPECIALLLLANRRHIVIVNKKGILSLICGVEYRIFDKSMHHDVHSFLPFHTSFEKKYLPFHTPFEAKCFLFPPQKTVHGKLKNAPPKNNNNNNKKNNAFLSLICRQVKNTSIYRDMSSSSVVLVTARLPKAAAYSSTRRMPCEIRQCAFSSWWTLRRTVPHRRQQMKPLEEHTLMLGLGNVEKTFLNTFLTL